ncbi:methyltransferase domain-containing protein [Pseudodesulfovibrio sp. F-1]|uniref:Methyltransferase domain-containing protein n=1 Tax=Pseudodesulfovibrio alkaliphilus TaxID=2661613 RepID=A0A7K1KQE6_9BACT|nr:methyltransferase domain-containing protein [Pseudodesulfovibrio alkaliphilus]MUM78112.1 methyltransferase domain-containing protein [Pseudodesulfovibrio alkaliphilus]
MDKMLNVNEHKVAFDRLYSKFSEGDNGLRFPLVDIGNHTRFTGDHKTKVDYTTYMYRRFSAHILTMLELEDGLDILSLGCGMGSDEKNIHNLFQNSRLWSTDISSEMVHRAIASQIPSNCSVAMAEALPFPDSCFDRIVSREVIEHVLDPSAMIKEVARVLKPGGLAVITTENEGSLFLLNRLIQEGRERFGRWINSPLPAAPNLYKDEAPMPEELKAMAEEVGLVPCQIIFDGALYKSIYRFIDRFPGLNVVPMAHRISSLENGPWACWFCDQYKIVLRKPASDEKTHEAAYCVPGGGNMLTYEGDSLVDHQSGQKFSIEDGIPVFIEKEKDCDGGVSSAPPAPSVRNRKGVLMCAGVGLDRFFVRNYPIMLVAIGWLAAWLHPSNRKTVSRHLKSTDLGKYVKLSLLHNSD